MTDGDGSLLRQVGGWWQAADADERPVRIMPVGDSSTLGSGRDYTWRYRLWRHLAAHPGRPPCGVEFTGPHEAMWSCADDAPTSLTYGDPDFDRRHCAVWGATLQSMAAVVQAAAAAHRPDIVLVHLGINDLAWYCGADDALGHLRTFIAAARAGAPSAALVFEPILPTQRQTFDPAFAAEVDRFAAAFPGVLAELDTPGSPLLLAPLVGGYHPQGDTYDGSHPNARGEIKIAASFAAALHASFAIGAPYGPIPDHIPNDVPAPARPTAVTGTTHTRLTWPRVPGAEGYNVYRRQLTGHDGTPGPDPDPPFERLAWPVVESSFSDDYLFNGAVYEFCVSALQDNREGPLSPAVRVAPSGPRPDRPDGLTLSVLPDGAAVLSWQPVDGVVGYYVYSRPAPTPDAPDPAWQRREFTIPDTDLELPPPADGLPREYRITAFGYAGESDPTEAVTVATPTARVGAEVRTRL